jgi:hypothetical protein
MWTPALLLFAATAATPPAEAAPDRELLEFLAEFALPGEDEAIDPLWLATPDAARELDAADHDGALQDEARGAQSPSAVRTGARQPEAERNDEPR